MVKSERLISKDEWHKNQKKYIIDQLKLKELRERNSLEFDLLKNFLTKRGSKRGKKIKYVDEKGRELLKERIFNEIVIWIKRYKEFTKHQEIILKKIPVANRDNKDMLSGDFSSKDIEQLIERVKTIKGKNGKPLLKFKKITAYLSDLAKLRKDEEIKEVERKIKYYLIRKINEIYPNFSFSFSPIKQE